MADIVRVAATIMAARRRVSAQRGVLVAISGIDASGKGYLTLQIAAQLEQARLRVATIGADGWLNLPDRRFNRENPAEHFYEHAFRFDEMFRQLVLPLKENRSICLVADFTEETATRYRKHTYNYVDVDVILVEGVFLLKPAYRDYFDLAFWVDCTFATAMERAVARGQEGLPPDQTIAAFETTFFPAARIHFVRDNPREAAHEIIENDPRLAARLAAAAGA